MTKSHTPRLMHLASTMVIVRGLSLFRRNVRSRGAGIDSARDTAGQLREAFSRAISRKGAALGAAAALIVVASALCLDPSPAVAEVGGTGSETCLITIATGASDADGEPCVTFDASFPCDHYSNYQAYPLETLCAIFGECTPGVIYSVFVARGGTTTRIIRCEEPPGSGLAAISSEALRTDGCRLPQHSHHCDASVGFPPSA
jgi:hypothetical protein